MSELISGPHFAKWEGILSSCEVLSRETTKMRS